MLSAWDHVRRFLTIWVIVAVILVVASIVAYWTDLTSAIVMTANSQVEVLVKCVVYIGAIWLLLSSVFPRR